MRIYGWTYFLSSIVAIVFCFASQSGWAQENAAGINRKLRERGASWEARDTEVSKLSLEQKKALLLPPGFLPETVGQISAPTTRRDLPSSFDWRNVNGKSYVTPPKNQGNLGSCWAMALTATLESYLLRNDSSLNASTLDLSEQTLFSCSSGSTLDQGMSFLSESGLPDEACFPYIGSVSSCSNACSDRAARSRKSPGWGSVPVTIEDIKYALVNYGPMWVSLKVSFNFFFYSSGILTPEASEDDYISQGHAVLLVGYDDAGRYFIIKNSWGTGWGEGGYAKISYDELTAGHFGGGASILLSCNRPTLSSDSIDLDHHAHELDISVTTDPAIYCHWQVQYGQASTTGFFALVNQAEGIGSSTLKVRVLENEKVIARNQDIVIGGNTLKINQAARPQYRLMIWFIGSGFGELVILDRHTGEPYYTICDTRNTPSGQPICWVDLPEGTEVYLTTNVFDGTSFLGYTNYRGVGPTPCTGNGECRFSLDTWTEIAVTFSGGSNSSSSSSSSGGSSSSASATPVPKVRLVAPNGGEKLAPGKSFNIKWESLDKKAKGFSLILLKNNKKVATLGSNLSISKKGKGSFKWKLNKKLKPGTDYKIKVSQKSCRTCTDTSDSSFSVGKVPVPRPTPTSTSTVPPLPEPSSTPIPSPTPIPPTATPSLLVDSEIIFTGLGGQQFVTTETAPSFTGIAQTSEQIDEILCTNITSAWEGHAASGSEWSISIPLVVGDNKIKCTLKDSSGEETSTEATITRHSQEVLASELSLSSDIAYVGETRQILARIMLAEGVSGAVSVGSSSYPNGQTAINLPMKDDGVAPDELKNDHIFSLEIPFSPSHTGEHCLRAKVTISGQDYYSEPHCIYTVTRYTQAQVDEAAVLADDVKAAYDSLLASGASRESAASSVAAQIKSDSRVGMAATNDAGGVWWITKNGILGLYYNSPDGQRGGASDAIPMPSTGEVCSSPKPLHKLSRSTTSENNEIKSPQAKIISPFIRHPTINSFGAYDDYFGAWNEVIVKANQCNLYPSAHSWFDLPGQVDHFVRIEHFQSLSDFGYIHFSTHGDTYYNGALSEWKDEWGKDLDKTFHSNKGVVVIYTGLSLTRRGDGTIDYAGHEDDFQMKRMAISPGDQIVLLPSFFSYYAEQLPNSMVVLAACRSMRNLSMASVLLNKGAGAVIGFSDYVSSEYAKNITWKIIYEMYQGKTVGEAMNEATQLYGESDADSTPAYTRLAGNAALTLMGTGVKNGDFETGKLSPWFSEGDGYISASSAVPNNSSTSLGKFSGLLVTSGSSESGFLNQVVCVPPTAQSLRFDWTMLSEEVPETCYSNDVFLMTLCEVDFRTGLAKANCDVTGTTVAFTTGDMCSAPYSSSLHAAPAFDSESTNDVWQYGWVSSDAIPVSQYGGKSLWIRFWLMEGADSLTTNSVVSVDNVRIE